MGEYWVEAMDGLTDRLSAASMDVPWVGRKDASTAEQSVSRLVEY